MLLDLPLSLWDYTDSDLDTASLLDVEEDNVTEVELDDQVELVDLCAWKERVITKEDTVSPKDMP